MDEPAHYATVEEIFLDFKGRRAGIVKALTTDVRDFYEKCDPVKDNLCLFGYSNEEWDVIPPVEDVPPEFPEPALGINYARDGMVEKDWLSVIAAHSDAWLISVAFYYGARVGFQKSDRSRLFNMINDLPSVFEVVADAEKKKQQQMEKSMANNQNSNNSKSNSKMEILPEVQGKMSASEPEDENDLQEEEEEEDGQETFCGACGRRYETDEFWICCDSCETWFHGKCVRITPTKAAHIKHYECPSCKNKRLRG